MLYHFILSTAFYLSFSYSNNIEGRWKTELDNSVIEFMMSSGVMSGKIIASDDKKNIGIVVIKSIVVLKNGKYECDIYDPKLKRYFNATLEFQDKNRLQVKVSCCFGLFNETYTWKRL